MKDRLKDGDNIYSVRGPILALSNSFAKLNILPKDVPDDRFAYLYAIKLGFKFKYIEKSLVWFKSPQTIKDQLNQGLRFRKDKASLYKYFDQSFIKAQYFIPLKLQILMFFYQIFNNPFAYFFMKYLYTRVVIKKALDKNKKHNPNWTMVLSTKKLTH
jgi:hypothetical protein